MPRLQQALADRQPCLGLGQAALRTLVVNDELSLDQLLIEYRGKRRWAAPASRVAAMQDVTKKQADREGLATGMASLRAHDRYHRVPRLMRRPASP